MAVVLLHAAVTDARDRILPDVRPNPSESRGLGAQPELHRCKQTVETIRSAAYWRQLCPQLHVASKRFQAAATSCASLPEARQVQLSTSIQTEGYAHVKAQELAREGDGDADGWMYTEANMRLFARSVVRLMQHGWPATFILMYDEMWALTHQMADVMRRATGNECNMDLLAWYVDPRRGDAGFSPHRDRQPDDAASSFRADGTPMYSTVWIPFTDAAPDNSCLYVLPRPYDPGYTAGDDDDSEVDPLPRALQSKQAYQNIRAVPAEAGSAVLFTHRIIHWGSKGRKDFHTPRISFSFGCSGAAEGWEPAYLRRDVHLPFPRVAPRAALASAQLIVYHERFQLDRRQLLLYHDTYTRSSELFSTAYQKEVTKEFVNATKEVAAGQPVGAGAVVREGSEGSDDGSDDGSEERVGEEEGSEDDMTERQMEAMLDAELGGFGEQLDDDFDMGQDNAVNDSGARGEEDEEAGAAETSEEEDVSTLDALDRQFLAKIDPKMLRAMQRARDVAAAKRKRKCPAATAEPRPKKGTRENGERGLEQKRKRTNSDTEGKKKKSKAK